MWASSQMSERKRTLLRIVLFGTACVLCAAGAQAGVTYDWWTGAAGDCLWSNKANWSNNKVPTSNSDILFDGDGTTDCIVDVDATVRRLRVVGSTGQFSGPYLHAIRVPVGRTLTTLSEFDVAGEMVVEGTLKPGSTGTCLLSAGTVRSGNLWLGPGSIIELAVGQAFQAQPGTSFTMAGTPESPCLVRCSVPTGAIGNFILSGNVSISHAQFSDLNDLGLQLSSPAGHTVSARNVTFSSSNANATTSQHLLVNGAAWQDAVFVGFSFPKGSTTSNPAFAVESTQNIRFRYYDTSDGCMFGNPYTDPASTGTVIWEPPDLVVTSIVPSNSNPEAGNTISVTVTVANQGSDIAQSFRVDLFKNRSSQPGGSEPGDLFQVAGPLAWGNSTVVTFSDITNNNVETWNIYASVDSDQAIPEWNTSGTGEANNVTGPVQVVWCPPGARPDLRITNIAPTSTTPTVGVTTQVKVTVTNEGTADAGAFRVDLFHDLASAPSVGQTGNQYVQVGSLPAGHSTDVYFDITSPIPDDWSMWAIVDTTNAVSESDETDNVSGPVTLQWQGIDLRVISISPSKTEPLLGEQISVTVTVKNDGNIAAGAFDLGLFYDEPLAPSPGSTADQTHSFAELAAGTQASWTFTGVQSSSTGQWRMYAVVDNASPPGAVSEYNETNNVSGPILVTWRAPNLVIQSITVKVGGELNTNPQETDLIDVEVLVANIGDAPAGPFTVGLYKDMASAPTTADTPDWTQNVSSLAENGATALVTFSSIAHQNTDPMIWRMYALADSGAAVTESQEGDNTAGPVTVTWGSVAMLEVTAPAAGEIWYAGTVRQIKWNSYGSVGDTVEIAYRISATSEWVTITPSTANDGSFDWEVPLVDSNDCRIRVSAQGGAVSDESDVFTISPSAPGEPDLIVTAVSPSNNEPELSETITIAVTVKNAGTLGAPSFRLELFLEGSPPASLGKVTVPSLAAGAEYTGVFYVTNSTDELWRVYAVADPSGTVTESNKDNNIYSPPVEIGWGDLTGASLRILSPNGGEKLEQGKPWTITWSATSALSMSAWANIEISTDGGVTWRQVVTNITIGQFSYVWQVDAPASDECRLRISNFAGTVSDVSDGLFTILPEGASALLYVGEGCGASHACGLTVFGLTVGLALARRRQVGCQK